MKKMSTQSYRQLLLLVMANVALPTLYLGDMFLCHKAVILSFTSNFSSSLADITEIADSLQPTRSQIIRICIGIYRKIDKTVKMYTNNY